MGKIRPTERTAAFGGATGTPCIGRVAMRLRPSGWLGEALEHWQGTCIMSIRMPHVADLCGTSAAQVTELKADACLRVGQMERRVRDRIQVRWRLRFLGSDSMRLVEGTTRDVSSGGLYFSCPVSFVTGECVICILHLPLLLPGRTRVLPIQFKVRIVRVDAADIDGTYGIGCEIQDYRLVQTLEASREGLGRDYRDPSLAAT